MYLTENFVLKESGSWHKYCLLILVYENNQQAAEEGCRLIFEFPRMVEGKLHHVHAESDVICHRVVQNDTTHELGDANLCG